MTSTPKTRAEADKRRPKKKKLKKSKKRIKKDTRKQEGKDPVLLYSMEIVPYGDLLFWSFAPTSELFLEEMHRTLPNLIPKPIPPDTRAHCEVFNEDGNWYPVIWISDPSQPWLLAHELEHYVHWFLDMKGLKFTNDSEEAYAYLIEFIMEMMITTRRNNRYPNFKPKNA